MSASAHSGKWEVGSGKGGDTPLPPKLRLCLYEPRPDSAYHPSLGTADLQAGKVLKMTICDRDRSEWERALKAMLAEFALMVVAKPEQASEGGAGGL